MIVHRVCWVDVAIAVLVQAECHRVVAIKLQVQVVESLALAAIDLVHPLTDPGFLIEDGSIQTEELYVHNLVFLTDGANVEHLTSSLNIRVISTNHLPLTRKIRFGQVVEVQIARFPRAA